MAFGDNTSLLFRIKGDASDAIRAFKDTEGAATGLTGSMAGLANPAALAATAITAVATAAVGVTVALFNVAKAAADYGSEIFDASEKTGLAAETISSIKFAAEQAGSSLEAVTGGLSRFAKTISEAEAGSDKAQAKLKTLGVTSADLDTALGQALTTIAKYPPGVEQMTAAQAAFGRSGDNLLPFIKSFDGNLPGLIAKCKELGLTIDGKTAKASDDFGDSLDTLQKQLGAVGKTIGIAVMPEFTKLFTSLSAWLKNNQSTVATWASIVGDAFRGVIKTAEKLRDAYLFLRAVNLAGYGGGNPFTIFANDKKEIERLSMGPDVGEPYLPGGKKPSDLQNAGGGIDPATGKTKTTTIGRADNQGDYNRAAREQAEKARKELLEIAEKGVQDVLELDRAETQQKLAELEQRHANELMAEADYIRERQAIEMAAQQYELDNFRELVKNDTLTADERKEIMRKIAILETELKTQRIKNAIEIKEAIDESTEAEREQLQAIQETSAAIDEMTAAIDRNNEASDRRLERQQIEGSSVMGGGGLGASIGDALGVDLVSIFDDNDAIKEKADYLQDIFADLKDGIGQSIGAIVSSMGQMVTAWLTGADFSAKAALKMAAGVAIGLAMQAGIKAIFEVAEGMAALASFNYYSAGLHFAAAKTYGLVALAAGVAGVGLGLAARAAGGGDTKAAAGSVATQTQRTERNVKGQGSYYSSMEDQTVGGSRNAPAVKVALRLELRSSGVVGVIEDSIRTNGRMRDLIIDTD